MNCTRINRNGNAPHLPMYMIHARVCMNVVGTKERERALDMIGSEGDVRANKNEEFARIRQ